TPMQNALTDGFEYVLGQNQITLQLYFENLRDVDVENNKNESSYNGAQISSAVEILQNVKDGILTKEQAMVFLIQFLKLDKDVATSMFNVGNSVQKLSSVELESYTDYPQEATENAKIALRYAENNGWGDCLEATGKIRANQLANREPISRDTISRMASFERHRQNSKKELGDGCGRLAWLAWGGDAGVEWAQRKLTKLSEEKKKIGIELIELGEDEDLDNYELIECKPVDYEEEEKLSYKFATSTGTANSNRRSIYDNDFYLFRYRYAGNSSPEREFCKNMMSANKIYRREDIEAMGDITVNPGFGKHPNPNDPYSIWKYKGGGLLSANFVGGTCKHYWEKLTYKIKDVKPDVKSPIAIDDAKKDRASGIAGIAPHDI
ncbi:MAG: hypothetical protein ACOVOV_09405, partial [Dolichospermum sp.]